MESKDLVEPKDYLEEALHKPGFPGYSQEKKWETINRLFQDAVDSGPCWEGSDVLGNMIGNSLDRPYDPIGIAKKGSEVGMKAIVLTSHVGPTFFRIPVIQQTVNEWAEACNIRPVQLIGSVTLNTFMGGLNPDIVRLMPRFGGKVIVMPTFDGWNFRQIKGIKGGIELVQNGKVVPELEEIIGIAADNDLVLNLNHVEPEQRMIIFDDAHKVGVKGYVYAFRTTSHQHGYASEEQWLELGKKGFKFAPSNATLFGSSEVFNKTWDLMQKIGVENLVSGTDLNNWGLIHPVDGLRAGMVRLLIRGMSERDIETMYKANPTKLLGL